MIIIISGPSGSGKTTIARLTQMERPNLHVPISCTTRPLMNGEKQGRDYHFISHAEFERRRDNGDFIEWAEVHGELYGTLKLDLYRADNTLVEDDVLLEIDCQGKEQICRKISGVVSIFIMPPSLDVLSERLILRKRGESQGKIKRRIQTAKQEMEDAYQKFDFVVINDKIHQAVKEVLAIIDRKHVLPISF